jgi:aspartate ammonia-lyase
MGTTGNTHREGFPREKAVPADAYYGVQTLRGKENFYITGIPMSLEPNFVKAFGYVKKARRSRTGIWACSTRRSPTRSPRLRSADRGRDARPVRDRLHPGRRGTSTNMNANEVIANLALEKLGHSKGEYQYVNPNDPRELRAVDERHVPTAFRWR